MATDKKKEEPKELSVFLKEPNHLQKFIDVSPNPKMANQYVQSALIAVADSEALRECTHASIFQAALRAASLGLSCDPALKQAWIVPYNKKVKGKGGKPDAWVKVAQFQPHYMGLYNLAMRTGKYLQINVSPILEGERVFEDVLTGLHAVKMGNTMTEPASYNPAYSRDVTVRRGEKDTKIIGWIGYFKTKNGFQKSVYMSVDEIEDHAAKYVKDYKDEKGKIQNPNWKDPVKRKVMEMKTVLKALLNFADKSGTVDHGEDLNKALKIDNGEEVIDAVTVIDDETGEIIPEQENEPKQEEIK
jgi:recombination protein RecT